jgi:hypothetical protein
MHDSRSWIYYIMESLWLDFRSRSSGIWIIRTLSSSYCWVESSLLLVKNGWMEWYEIMIRSISLRLNEWCKRCNPWSLFISIRDQIFKIKIDSPLPMIGMDGCTASKLEEWVWLINNLLIDCLFNSFPLFPYVLMCYLFPLFNSSH